VSVSTLPTLIPYAGRGHRSVLVVDDDTSARSTVVAILEAEGFLVVEAGNGREALDQLEAGLVPGAILLDLFMPVLDGWATLRAIRRNRSLSSIPVMVLSAAGREGMDRAPGATAYLRKPLDPEELLRRLAACTAA
jgi:CheY-like chemotaxis protein